MHDMPHTPDHETTHEPFDAQTPPPRPGDTQTPRPGIGPDMLLRWAENSGVPWPEMKRRMGEAIREGWKPGDPEWRRFFRQFVEGDPNGTGTGEGGKRSNVLSLRVDDVTLGAIDGLVEAGLFATRAESATWLLQAGVRANTELFNHIRETVGEIRRLREELQQRMHEAVSDDSADESSPAASPHITEADATMP